LKKDYLYYYTMKQMVQRWDRRRLAAVWLHWRLAKTQRANTIFNTMLQHWSRRRLAALWLRWRLVPEQHALVHAHLLHIGQCTRHGILLGVWASWRLALEHQAYVRAHVLHVGRCVHRGILAGACAVWWELVHERSLAALHQSAAGSGPSNALALNAFDLQQRGHAFGLQQRHLDRPTATQCNTVQHAATQCNMQHAMFDLEQDIKDEFDLLISAGTRAAPSRASGRAVSQQVRLVHTHTCIRTYEARHTHTQYLHVYS